MNSYVLSYGLQYTMQRVCYLLSKGETVQVKAGGMDMTGEPFFHLSTPENPAAEIDLLFHGPLRRDVPLRVENEILVSETVKLRRE